MAFQTLSGHATDQTLGVAGAVWALCGLRVAEDGRTAVADTAPTECACCARLARRYAADDAARRSFPRTHPALAYRAYSEVHLPR